jgi:DNA transformation protein
LAPARASARIARLDRAPEEISRRTLATSSTASKASTGSEPRLRSLAVSKAFTRFVLDQLEEVGGVTPRPMFGGVGLYHGGVFFGILARDTLYLKVDERNRADYESAGSKPFRPYPNRSGSMRYYAVPLSVLESAPELAEWARKAVRAASKP